MKRAVATIIVSAVAGAAALALAQTHTQPAQRFEQPMPPEPNPNSQYRLGPDSMPQEGVPKGEIRGPYHLPSHIYPGTQHTYWVYVPAQYDPSISTALMIYQDGQAFKDETGDIRAQNVMDNLIYRREIPVMLAVFINPGRTPEQVEPSPQTGWGDGTTNRVTEYNSLDDKYARVITEELTERVLESEKKPIRVFLCDGRNDHRGFGRDGVYNEKRDWFFQNVRLMKALTQKGYDMNYTWGMNLHGQKFGGAVMPDMMRWLWRDGPVSTDPNDMVERAFRQPAAKGTN
ncbi:MAG: esterase family protein [Bryobacteraceae bacterium]